jgi:hypothetical protein
VGADRQGRGASLGIGPLKKRVAATVVCVAAVAALVALALPPRRAALSIDRPDGSIAGIIHVHSTRSDGSSAPEQIADAAARAGLRFVVFTDHGDATRTPDAPVYRSGVLCIDAVEISTTGGHYVAIDMPAAPYPLGGEPRDVVDDVHRLGGFGIVAHPDSPKEELRWNDFNVPFDGIEVVNLDTSWRRWTEQMGRADAPQRSRWAAAGRLLAALVDYPFRPPEIIASLTAPTARDAAIEQTLDRELQRRRIVTTAAADAHARLAFRGDPSDSAFSIPIPGYEQTFRALSVHVSSDEPLTGDAVRDARTILRGIRAGHLYNALDGSATPAAFAFSAENKLGTAREGDELRIGGPVTLRVHSNAPDGFTTTVWNGATQIDADRLQPDFAITVPSAPAAYWVRVQADAKQGRVTWLRSNPIFIRSPESEGQEGQDSRQRPDRGATALIPIFDGKSTSNWKIEHDATSVGALDLVTGTGGPELRLRYGLSSGMASGPFVALVYDVPQGTASADQLRFTVRAQQPMRISVQLRSSGAERSGGERWQRSVYVSNVDEDRTVDFRDMMPIGRTSTQRPSFDTIRTVLFVVDTTNTKAGASGRVWFESVAFAR